MTLGRTWASALLALTVASAPAWAVTYRNPAHDVEPGQVVFGFVFEEYERTYDIEFAGEEDIESSVIGVSAGFGMASGGALSLMVGASSFSSDAYENEMNGVEAAVSYRHNLDFAGKLDEGADPFDKFRKGLLASIRIGNAEDSDGTGIDYYQYDLGFGVGTNVIRQVQAYGGGVISWVDGTGYSEGGADVTVESVDPLGVFAGIQYVPQKELLVGAELHLVHEWGFGLYVEYLMP